MAGIKKAAKKIVDGLYDTLQRRKARGDSVDPIARFGPKVRTAIATDIALVMTHGVERDFFRVGHRNDKLRGLRTFIIQHVLNGWIQRGPHIDGAEMSAGTIHGDWRFCLALLLDAVTDLEALDILEAILRFIDEAADHLENYFGKGAYDAAGVDEGQMEVLPPQIEFVREIRRTIVIINQRLVEADIGYQFLEAKLVRSPEPNLALGVVAPCLVALRRNKLFHDTEVEFEKALAAWKARSDKEAVLHSAEALEGMLRVLVREVNPGKYKAGLQIPASVDILASSKLWPQAYGEIMKKIYAIRGDRGAHSEATKPQEQRANSIDAEAMVYLSAAMLVLLSHSLDEYRKKKADK